MTQEEKNEMYELLFKDLIKDIEYEIIGFETLRNDNEKKSKETKFKEWEMFYKGKRDAYDLTAKSLKKLLKIHNGKDL